MTNTNQKLLAKNEYQDKLNIKKRIAKYYHQQAIKNGLCGLKKIKSYLPSKYSFRHLERDIVFAHLDLEPILELIENGEEFAVVSGLNPSSPLHLGHKGLFDILIELQKLNARVYIPITNDESYLDDKAPTLAESRKIARETIIPSILAFGFDSTKTHLFIDSDYPDLYIFATKISKYITLKMLKQVFGNDALSNVGQIFYRGAVQIAQILLPQLPEFGGPKHTLIPVGIDQHPYVLLARDVAKKMNMIPPSELVMKFQPSLLNPEEKMSASKSNTAIYLSDSNEVILKKINKTYTGAVSSLETHRKLGGFPEICSVYSLFNFHHTDNDFVFKIFNEYKSGKLTMKKLKELASSFVVEMVGNHQKSQLKMKNDSVRQFLVKKPIRSFL